MDPNSARAALRLDPALPLTPDLVERAFQQESWARHPSRYPDAEGRAAAEQWAGTLATARATLLDEVARATHSFAAYPVPTTHAPAPANPPHSAMTPAGLTHAAAPDAAPRPARRGRTAWIVSAIAVGAAVVIAAGFGLFFGLQAITERVADQVRLAEAQARLAESQAVDRFAASETAYTFPAALEIYSDGRLWDECDAEFEQGCWQMAVFPTQSCDRMEVVLGFNTGEYDYEAEETRTVSFADVVADASTHVVFGNDEYPYGWVEDVVCLDANGV